MFWKRLKEFTRTLSFRLNVWHAAIFLVTAAFIFTLIYFLLGAAINRKDRDVIEARLREYVAVYKSGGIAALRDWTERVNEARKERMFFVRVTKPDGTVPLLVMPQDWFDQDLQQVDRVMKARPRKDWQRVPRNLESDLTLASVVLDDGTVFQVGRSSDSRDALLGKFRQVFVIVIPPVVVLGFIGGALLTRRMTKPVCDLVGAASAILNTGRMDVRVPQRPADDELQDLVVLFNRMLAHNENLFHALRDSLDNVAHDLRTPLSRLRMHLENSLCRISNSEEAQDGVAEALEETERVQTIIQTLMDVAQAESGLLKLKLAPTDLRSLLDEVIGLYEHVAQEKNIAIQNDVSSGVSVELDSLRMRQAFANLLDNAIKYTPIGGRVSIAAHRLNRTAEVIFSDTGCGIPEKDLPRIWERLYRGDKSRNAPGLGLGLSLVKAIVEAHGGHIEVISAEGKGTAFRVYLSDDVSPALQHLPESGRRRSRLNPQRLEQAGDRSMAFSAPIHILMLFCQQLQERANTAAVDNDRGSAARTRR